jgi:iron complex outermembrane receptor protein
VPFAGGTGNIPQTDIYGVETEFGWAISDSWHLEGQVTWMDGEFSDDLFTLDVVDFREALEPGLGLFTQEGFDARLALSQSTNLKGNKPPKMVDLSARIALTNTFDMSSQGQLTTRLEFVYRGEYQYRVYNNPLVDNVPDYNIVNLFLQYDPPNSPLSFALTVSNLFDESGVNSRFSNPFGLLTTSEEFIPPLQVVASLRYVF